MAQTRVIYSILRITTEISSVLLQEELESLEGHSGLAGLDCFEMVGGSESERLMKTLLLAFLDLALHLMELLK